VTPFSSTSNRDRKALMTALACKGNRADPDAGLEGLKVRPSSNASGAHMTNTL
jgi:hypothetical protein